MFADDFVEREGRFVDHVRLMHPNGPVMGVEGSRASLALGTPWPNPARDLVVAALALSAVLTARPADCAWRVFGTRDGLYGARVSAIAGDNQGNLWLANGAVTRTDGLRWRTFTAAEGAPVGNPSTIVVDANSQIWVGSGSGALSRYDGTRWETLYAPYVGGGEGIGSLVVDRRGTVWLGTETGLRRFDVSTRTSTFVPEATSGINDGVQALAEDHNGVLWVASGYSGVTRFDGTSWRHFTPQDGPGDYTVISIAEDTAGNLWFGTTNGLRRFDGAAWTTFASADTVSLGWVRDILPDREGNIWVPVDGRGLARYDGSRWRVFSTRDGLISDTLTPLFEDSSEQLWFAVAEGVARWDRVAMRTYTTSDGMGGNAVTSMTEDARGVYWVSTPFAGITRLQSSQFSVLGSGGGIDLTYAKVLSADREGSVWFSTLPGVTRYHPDSAVVWKAYTTANTQGGLLVDDVTDVFEDQAGAHWFTHYYNYSTDAPGGASRLDASGWSAPVRGRYKFTAGINGSDGSVLFADSDIGLRHYDPQAERLDTYRYPMGPTVEDVAEGSPGEYWAAIQGVGAARWDGAWRSFRTGDGLPSSAGRSILRDRIGRIWVGCQSTDYAATNGGVAQYDGERWRSVTTVDGLPSNDVYSLFEDRDGTLWIGTGRGLVRYDPDRIAPHALFSDPLPRAISPDRTSGATFAVAFKETEGIEFSWSLDGSAWSAWSTTNAWIADSLWDGVHRVECRARDVWGNVDSAPSVATFEIDATPPTPVLARPVFGEALRGVVRIEGTASDPRFRSYRVEFRASSAAWLPVAPEAASPVTGGIVATWDTRSLADGPYDLRLAVLDTLGLAGTVEIRVIVDNQEPFSDVTAPARVSANDGGDVFLTHSEAHLYFPPHALERDAVVGISPLLAGEVPADPGGGALLVLNGYEVSLGGVPLLKPALLELSTAGLSRPGSMHLAIYQSGSDGVWRHKGGTVESSGRITTTITEPGRFAVYAESTPLAGGGGIARISMTPRVLSRSGGFSRSEVAIGFELARAGAATVTIYNRAGRLVKEVASGIAAGTGANIVRWDGRNREGDPVVDGLYLIVVDALGETKTATLAVVR